MSIAISPLLDLADFYRTPFYVETEDSIEITLEDEGEIVRGRIDIMFLKQQFWLLVIESKQTGFSLLTAIPQALAYMLANPKPKRPAFGLVTNGDDFQFIKLTKQDTPQYALYDKFTLSKRENELYKVLSILKKTGSNFEPIAMSQRPIYLDCHATTPLDDRVLSAMIPYFTEHFGNPSSINHLYGWEAEAAVKQARQVVADAINATPEEIVFTSGATEANNLALKGVAEAYFSKGRHIITLQTEHSAVLDPCQYLRSLGFEITILPVQKNGLIDLTQLEAAFRPDTILVSVMAANNEIGVLQPLAEIGGLCRDAGVLFHTDAAQAIGKIPLDVEAMKIDLLSMTAHKVYGPKGIGALYVRRRHPRVQLSPQLHGGGHERGMRSGTLYPPQIVGFAKAVELALTEQATEIERLTQLRQQLWQQLQQLDGIHLNGHPTQRLPGNLNISVEGVDGAALLLGLQPVMAVSSGSACSSATTAPSHVLTALGHPEQLAYASIRFGIGRFNTAAEIDKVAQHAIATISSLRQQTSLV